MKLRDRIKIILQEETSSTTKIRRRTHDIDREFKRVMSSVYRPSVICQYKNSDMLIRVVTEAIVENLYYNTFNMVDDTSKEWEGIVNFIYEYVQTTYGQELTDYYNNN